MQVLPGDSVRLPTPCAEDLAQTLLGLPFFAGMTQGQCERRWFLDGDSRPEVREGLLATTVIWVISLTLLCWRKN